MSLITSFTVLAFSDIESFLEWTSANASDTSYVFLNGRLVYGPYNPGTATRSLIVPLKYDDYGKFDIHDFTSSRDDNRSIEVEDYTKPKIKWTHDGVDTVAYYVYHKKGVSGDEVQIYQGDKIDDTVKYEIDCPILLDEGWHFFRVEALNEYGNETTVDAWPFFVFDTPGVLSSVSIAGAAGSFTLTIAE